MRKIELKKEKISLKDEIEGFLERTVTKFGNSGKVDCPRRFIGRRVYLIVCKEDKNEKRTVRRKKQRKRDQNN